MAIVALVLLIACANVANLLLARAVARQREIDIRKALGAQNRDVLKLVVAQGMKLALLGVGIGLAAALGLTRLMTTLLFNVSATDPLVLAGVVSVLTFVALLACWIPARRATKVDPMIALRSE